MTFAYSSLALHGRDFVTSLALSIASIYRRNRLYLFINFTVYFLTPNLYESESEGIFRIFQLNYIVPQSLEHSENDLELWLRFTVLHYVQKTPPIE